MKKGDLVRQKREAALVPGSIVRIYNDESMEQYDFYFDRDEIAMVVSTIGQKVFPTEFRVQLVTSTGKSGWVWGTNLETVDD